MPSLAVLAVQKLGLGAGVTGCRILWLRSSSPHCPIAGLAKGFSGFCSSHCGRSLLKHLISSLWDLSSSRDGQKAGWPAPAQFAMELPVLTWINSGATTPQSRARWAGAKRPGQSHGRRLCTHGKNNLLPINWSLKTK